MKRARWPTVVVVGVLAALWLVAWVQPLPERLTVAPSTEVTWKDGTVANVALAPDDRWRLATSLDDVDPAYVAALVRLEDKRFWWHPGVDPVAITRAIAVNLRAGRVETGASTLTLQLVRVLEPRPRTLRSKLVEAARAATLEARLSKREILAAYLTFAPYGGNLEGVRAASFAYFGHDADHLSPAEIAVLLAVPQSPAARRPGRSALKAGRDDVARKLHALGALPVPPGGTPDATLAEILASPVPAEMAAFPRAIPHVATWLRAGAPDETRIETTLDRGAQSLAERALDEVEAERAAQGIHNATVVVVEHATGRVVALVGGFSFWDAEHGGQILAFDNPRSPGSALKPLIYALAIDRGLALPEHLLADVPRSYGTYKPKNYDGSFDGLVPMQEALSRSLNLPFVDLLQEIGVEPFLGTLRSAGARHLVTKPGWYGLSIAAGGIELTPLEMAGIYATLGADGAHRPLRIRADDPEGEALQVLTPGATWLTRRALSLKDRPDFPARWKVSAAPRDIAWKTGTSFGHHDAWAAGWGARYAAVVWMGNLDNRPAVDLLGSDAAGPVLFDVLEGMAEPDARPPARPSDLVDVEVCAYSGHLPGPACPTRRTALALHDHVPTESCPYHAARDVDVESGLSLTPACRAGRTWETRTTTTSSRSRRRGRPAAPRRGTAPSRSCLRRRARSPCSSPDCRRTSRSFR